MILDYLMSTSKNKKINKSALLNIANLYFFIPNFELTLKMKAFCYQDLEEIDFLLFFVVCFQSTYQN